MNSNEQMFNDRLLSFLGIARRAGRLSLGFDSVCESVRKGESRAVLIASDASEGTVRRLRSRLPEDFADVYQMPYDIDRINAALGKGVRLISVNDKGFANKIKEMLGDRAVSVSGQGEE